MGHLKSSAMILKLHRQLWRKRNAYIGVTLAIRYAVMKKNLPGVVDAKEVHKSTVKVAGRILKNPIKIEMSPVDQPLMVPRERKATRRRWSRVSGGDEGVENGSGSTRTDQTTSKTSVNKTMVQIDRKLD